MRRQYMTMTSVLVLTIFWMLAAGRDAHAYLDPGSGSYLFQIGLVAVLGGVFTLKNWWGEVKQIVRRLCQKEKD